MTIKACLLSSVILSFTLPVTVWAAQPYHPANTEIGFVTHQVPSQKTRSEVLAEASEWRQSPVSSDGWRMTSTEKGSTLEAQSPQAVAGAPQLNTDRPASGKARDMWVWVDGEAGWAFRPSF